MLGSSGRRDISSCACLEGHTFFYLGRLIMVFMYAHTYAPVSLSQIVGNSDVITEIRLWASAWRQGQAQKPLLLVGPPGIGKTLAAYVVAKEFGWSLVEFNSSDARDKETIEKVVYAAAVNASFTGQLRLVLLDEIDGVQGTEDKGGLSAILNVLKEARNPIILTANDIYGDTKLAGIRTFCKMLPMKKIPYPSIAKYLRDIAEAEKIDYDAFSINELAKNSSGDVRAALLDFQTATEGTKKITLEDVQSLGYRERLDNVFNAMRTVFVSTSLQEIRRARSSVEVDHDMFKKWVEENIPRQFPMPLSLASAFDGLSRADIFDGRIFRRQHYGFLKYSGDLSASVGLRTNERAHGFISYQFPTILKRLSLMKGSSKKSLVKKIQSQVRGSRSRIMQELVYYGPFLESSPHAAEWLSLLELDEDELAYLLQATPTSAKVKKLLKAAEEWKESHAPRSHSTHSSPAAESPTPVEESKSRKKGKGKEDVPEKTVPAPSESKKQTSLSTFFG